MFVYSRSKLSAHFQGDIRMEFYFIHRLFSVLLLVALICTAQGATLQTKRSILHDIGTTFNEIGKTITGTVKNGINSVLNKPSESSEIETTTELESNTTSDYRNIINVPGRCPPNHSIVNNRCRLSY